MALDFSAIDNLLKARQPNTALIGFRSWIINDPKLTSIGLGDTTWKTQMQAVCKASDTNREKHSAPGEFCDCGLYAYHNPSVIKEEEISKLYKSIVSDELSYSCHGIVLGSGKVQVQESGWRAEKAQVVALIRTNNKAVEKWALNNNLPLIDYWDIEDFTDLLKASGCSSMEASFKPYLPERSKTRRKQGLLDSSTEPSLVIDGNRFWFKQGILHRTNGPAIESLEGERIWCRNGKVFREDDKPAITNSNNKFWAPLVGESYSKKSHELFDIWFENQKIHRENNPAVVSKKGIKKWFHKGSLHREDGPAAEYPDGSLIWFQNGLCHRDNGPAEIRPKVNANESWYRLGEIHRDNGPARITPQGMFWYKNGLLHRDDDLPAAIHNHGAKVWWQDGVIHRENGPAIVSEDGTKKWFRNHKLDRKDGPAVERSNGDVEYWIAGKKQDDSDCKKTMIPHPPLDMSVEARKILMRIDPNFIEQEMEFWEEI